MLYNARINDGPAMSVTMAAYDRYGEGLIMMSAFDYSSSIKACVRELKKKVTVTVNYSSSIVEPKNIEVETAHVLDSDYSHMVVYKKDITYGTDSNPYLKFFTFMLTDKDNDNDITEMTSYSEEFLNLVYDKLYKMSPIPVLKEWTTFILEYLISNRYMTQATTISADENRKLFCTVTTISVEDLLSRIQYGLQEGLISINGSNSSSDFMREVDGIDEYLHQFSEPLTRKIQQSFVPLFIPQQDQYSNDLTLISDYMSWSDSISLYPAQKDVAQAVSNAFDKKKCCFVIGEMGVNCWLPYMVTYR